jgi:hypothetical protein
MTNEHLFKEEPNLIQSQQTPHGATGVAPRQIYQQPVYQQPQQPAQ